MRLTVTCAAVLTAWLTLPAADMLQAQQSLERAMLQQAPKLIHYFKAHGYHNVGVLKFLVNREGEKKFSDTVGTLNLLLARRLELALVLANDPRKPVGIIENASAVAHKTQGASHLSKEGRLKLFAASYPLAWGDQKVQADAFVTGTAEIGQDLKTLTISLFLFDQKGNKLMSVLSDFQAANRADRLAEMGESFVLRGAFDDGQTEPTEPTNKYQQEILVKAIKVHSKAAVHPAQQADVPVALEVYYDGRKVPLEVRDGKAYIPEPNEGQKVELVLKRDSSRERYGVVLKVNGENILDRQRQPDLSCRMWVRDPGQGPLWIDGYTLGKDRLQRFQVLSLPESKAREVNYGADVGTITMTVFREYRGKQDGGYPSDEAAKELLLVKLPEPKERAKNYNALKATLLDDANRGLIAESAHLEKTEVTIVRFRPDPRPVMCLTVVYYKR